MPIFNQYPAATSIADSDTLLMWDTSEGAVVQPTVAQIAQKVVSAGGISVDSVASLRTLAVADLIDGQPVSTLGYYEPGDGGGGVFVYNSTATGTDNGGTLIAPTSGAGRWLRAFDSVVNVLWFGAKGDNTADDSGPIQDAIDYATSEIDNNSSAKFEIYFPPGNYFITQTINVRRSHIALIGAQNRLSAIRRSFTGGFTISVKPATTGGTNTAFGCHVKNLYLYADTEMTSGGHLELEDVWESSFTDISTVNGFGGISITGCNELRFDRFQVVAGQFGTASLKSGSYGIQLVKSSHTYPNATMIYFNQGNVQSLAFPWLERGIWVKSADGVWFTDVHAGGCNVNFHVSGASQALISGIFASKCYFDGFFGDGVTTYGVLLDDDGSYAAGDMGNFMYDGCTFAGNNNAADTGRGFVANSPATKMVTLNGCTFGANGRQAVHLLQGSTFAISGGSFRGNNVAAAANIGSITVSNAVSNVTINGAVFNDTGVANGIRVENTASGIAATGNSFLGMTTPTLDGSTSITNRWTGNSTDQSLSVASAGTITVLDIADYVLITGTTNVNTINSKHYQGRLLRCQFDGILTVSDGGGNLVLVGNFVTAANSVLVLMSNGSGAWYEVSRSSP